VGCGTGGESTGTLLNTRAGSVAAGACATVAVAWSGALDGTAAFTRGGIIPTSRLNNAQLSSG
jgi:hypothetical protein